jgi:aromatic-L-amino-acid decarboxylase
MLFVPFDFSALYLRKIEHLRRLFSLAPEHLHLRDPGGAEINYMDYGVQLGRRFRALKAWVVWRAFGREKLAAVIREHLRLAKLFGDWIEKDDRFELAAPIVMGVVCFRFIAADKTKIDKVNSEIVERINASGRAYITQTRLRGRTVMRIGLGNILTTEEHLREVWKIIREAIGRGD